MQLYLIRHPKPDIDAGICYGRSDIGLADDPVACAAALRDRLPATAVVCTSPLRRCLELAQALSATPVIDERLVEMDFGAWEMRRWDDIPRREIDAWAADPAGYAPPGGESPSALRARVRAFLADRRGERDVVVVTHGGVMKLFVAEVLALPVERWSAMRFAYGEVVNLDLGV